MGVTAWTCLVKVSRCLFTVVWLAKIAGLSFTPKTPLFFFSASWCSFSVMFSIRFRTSWSVLVLILPPAEASRNILLLADNPSVKTCRYDFSSRPCDGHLLSNRLKRSQASYKVSLSPCLKFVISCFLSQYLDMGKYRLWNLSSSSSQVWMVPLGMDNNHYLALPVWVKGNSLSFFWLSVTWAGGTQNWQVSWKWLRCSWGLLSSHPSN